ncbi:FAD/NAD(P)-binding domain-containing protein [Hypoxylon sp. FL1284]|nr:FAD/NAD(P)-binding domain-containing protein [Hypoxylon sp. FL1284]
MNVSSVAVIGAGPTGLAAAKYLLAEGFPVIDVFEKQGEVGGMWHYEPGPPDAPSIYAAEDDEDGAGKESPMYDDLNTNIPHTLMRFSDLPFRAGCAIFPPREDVQAYLEQYARSVRHLVHFSTQVVRVNPDHHQQQERWDVRTRDLTTGKDTSRAYDAVVVASGHYYAPHVPADIIAGAAAFDAAYPGALVHSKFYRSAAPYRGKKVVVVGTGPSGLDIAAQVGRACAPPLLVSARTAATPEALAHLGDGVEQVGQIVRFGVEGRSVEFAALGGDGEGGSGTRVVEDVDAVIFCTGYRYTFPFLDLDNVTSDDGKKVRGLAKHLLCIDHPTLAFPGLPIKVIPFPLAESQAAIFSRLWSGRLALPRRATLKAWERADAEAAAGPDKYHVFAKGGDGRYINEVHEWLTQETKRKEDDSSVSGGGGSSVEKEPPHWNDEMLWQRSIYVEAKMKFEKDGRRAKTLEELGFGYKPGESTAATSPGSLEKRDPQLGVAG